MLVQTVSVKMKVFRNIDFFIEIIFLIRGDILRKMQTTTSIIDKIALIFHIKMIIKMETTTLVNLEIKTI